MFINPAQTPKTRALTDFVALADMGIRPGDDTAMAVNMPAALPGRALGRMDGAGVWVYEWTWMPSAYMFGIHLDAPKPLIQRIDPADTGLGQGLQLVAQDVEYPFTSAYYSHRFGFGCGNRLNGVAMFIDAGAWAVPSAYD